MKLSNELYARWELRKKAIAAIHSGRLAFLMVVPVTRTRAGQPNVVEEFSYNIPIFNIVTLSVVQP